jgi:hypothetical protein
MMKKNKLIKTVLLLFVAFVFSNCEEDGAIQFVIVDDFETNASVSGLEGFSSIDITRDINISDLLDNVSTFVEADVESVVITLNDYDGDSIEGNFSCSVGGISLFNQAIELIPGVATNPIAIPSSVSSILSSITSGIVQVQLTGSTNSPIADDDFSLNLKIKVKAKVE